MCRVESSSGSPLMKHVHPAWGHPGSPMDAVLRKFVSPPLSQSLQADIDNSRVYCDHMLWFLCVPWFIVRACTDGLPPNTVITMGMELRLIWVRFFTLFIHLFLDSTSLRLAFTIFPSQILISLRAYRLSPKIPTVVPHPRFYRFDITLSPSLCELLTISSSLETLANQLSQYKYLWWDLRHTSITYTADNSRSRFQPCGHSKGKSSWILKYLTLTCFIQLDVSTILYIQHFSALIRVDVFGF